MSKKIDEARSRSSPSHPTPLEVRGKRVHLGPHGLKCGHGFVTRE